MVRGKQRSCTTLARLIRYAVIICKQVRHRSFRKFSGQVITGLVYGTHCKLRVVVGKFTNDNSSEYALRYVLFDEVP